MARTRRRSENTRPTVVVTSGVLTIAVLGLLALIALRSADGVPLRDYTTVYVDVPDSGTLRGHDPVRIAGTRVGQVLEVTTTRAGRARAKLQIEPDTGPLPADTKVAIRSLGLVGARYLELRPGNDSRTLRDGETLTGGEDTLTYGLVEAIDTFDPRTRAALESLVRGFGEGLLGRGQDISDVIVAGNVAQRPFRQIARAVLERPGAAQRLVPSLAAGAAALAATREPIGRSLEPTARGLAPFVAERAAVRSALDHAPGALRTTAAAVHEGRRLLAVTRTLATQAQNTLGPAPAGLRATARLLRTAPGDLRRTIPLLHDARASVGPVLRITRATDPLLAPARKLLQDALPLVVSVGRHGCDVAHLGTVLRSMTGLGVAGSNGTGPGGNPQTGPPMHFRLALVPSTYEILGQKPPDGYGEHDPYPAACRYAQGAALLDPLVSAEAGR